MAMKHWQNWGMLLLGVWLFVSPWVFGYADMEGLAAWGTWMTGLVIASLAIAEIYKVQVWEEWVTLLLGIWTLASPWALGFDSLRDATFNAVIAGMLIMGLALWALGRDHAFDDMLRGT